MGKIVDSRDRAATTFPLYSARGVKILGEREGPPGDLRRRPAIDDIKLGWLQIRDLHRSAPKLRPGAAPVRLVIEDEFAPDLTKHPGIFIGVSGIGNAPLVEPPAGRYIHALARHTAEAVLIGGPATAFFFKPCICSRPDQSEGIIHSKMPSHHKTTSWLTRGLDPSSAFGKGRA